MHQKISSNWLFLLFCFAFVACSESQSRRDSGKIQAFKSENGEKKGEEESEKKTEMGSAVLSDNKVVPESGKEVSLVAPNRNVQSPTGFQMRGANYARLRRGNDGNMYHSTF